MDEDVGAVDGQALGAVAGQRVAVVKVLGRVGEGDAPVGASVVANDECVVVEADDGAAHPVAEAAPMVVSAAEDLVADAELALTERDRGAAEPALVEHKGVRGVVEVIDVGAAVGEHHVPRRAAALFLPPVVEQPFLCVGRVAVDVEAAASGGVGEVELRVAAAEAGERLAFEWVELAAVAGQLERAEPIAERLVETAGAHGRQLARVADE
jgi:hypothetical protein